MKIEKKITDSGLKEFTKKSGSREKRTVIVELSLPPPKIKMNKSERMENHMPKTDKYGSIDIENIEGHKSEMNELERKLNDLGIRGKSIKRLNVAHAYIVTVNSDQLKKIAKIELAGVIRPNRVHMLNIN